MSANAVRAAEVVAEARAWIGTPVQWQQAVKGRGCDCRGLVAGVARALGLPEGEALPARVMDYGRAVPVYRLNAGLVATFDRVPEMAPGDVLLLRMGGTAQHLGVFTGPGVVHAYGRGQRHVLHRVIETPLASALRAWPLDSIWRWRSVDYGAAL